MQPLDQTALMQAITGQYMLHWRVPAAIQEVAGLPIRLAVMQFHLRTANGESWRYATNGLSWQVSQGDVPYRTEFYLATRGPCEDAARILIGIVRYVLKTPEGIAPFDTVPLDDSAPTLLSRYSGLLAVPPEPLDNETMGAFNVGVPEPVVVNRVVGLLREEFEVAVEQGGEEFWDCTPEARSRYLDVT